MHTNKRVTNLLLRFILFKWVLSYVTQYFNQSKGLNMLRFNLNAKKLVVIETAVIVSQCWWTQDIEGNSRVKTCSRFWWSENNMSHREYFFLENILAFFYFIKNPLQESQIFIFHATVYVFTWYRRTKHYGFVFY